MDAVADIGNIEDSYEVVGVLDNDGGFGDIYVAHDRRSRAKVAIKTQKSWRIGPKSLHISDGRRLVEVESRHMMTLRGIEAIPRLLATGTYRGNRCLVMEFVKGRQLRNVVEKRPVKDLSVVASIIGQLCEILHDVHARDLVHCDLKPENVIVEPDGRLRLIDMGQAVRANKETSDGFGTTGYAAPEQLEANQDGLTSRADIFALGAMLLEMTVMQLPYGGPEERVEQGHPVLPAERIATIPSEFRDLALRMVAWEAEDRPANVREVFEAIRPHLPKTRSDRPLKPLSPDPTEYYRSRPPRL
ncbi:serine/threonine-protein kinase [Streptomyces sp. NPDC048290]|uniref:serine/threonine protein kinase n=1 Tax=Streptomyces sp. NPDC048290 TaxID=3155811 RepID=UPI00342D789E